MYPSHRSHSCPAHPITKDYPRCGQIGTPACSANRVCVPYSITAQPPPLSNPGYSSNFPPAKQSPPPQPQQPQQPQGPNWGTPLQQQQQTPPQQPPPQQSPPQQPPPQQPPPQQPPPQQPPPQQPPLQQPPPQQPQPQQPQSGVGGQPNKPLAKCPDNLGCPDNLVCIADPRDELTASRGTSFMCVEGGAEATCAGFKNIQCPNGGICVADPRIECFGAGCTGVCA
ncbi:hypothetical protein BLS_000194 [Venturia inaequalis]|uniref:Uncharacterized protein n=1 Tax=Venturia inaequalis TaxID=5025 RepID=A0A8H3ZDV6_VENIN|nr:hypothetical protein BLS_000194 [Venturia inaequalis]KAE9989697.1 hypothetical protein EG327_002378 [Venturia inaequalis]